MKTGLLLSGGMDSLAPAWWKRLDIVFILNYGQLAAQAEIEASRMIRLELNIPHHVIEIDCRQLGSGDMVGTQADTLAPASNQQPYRNQILVTLGAVKVISFGVTHLWLGIVKPDGFHKDGSSEFMSAISHLLSLQEDGMVVGAPAIELSIVELMCLSSIPARLLAWVYGCHKSRLACGNYRGYNKYMEVPLEVGYNLGRPGWSLAQGCS